MSQNVTRNFLVAISFVSIAFSFQNCGSQFRVHSLGQNSSSLLGGTRFALLSTDFSAGKSLRCGLENLSGSGKDASVALQSCIDGAAAGDILAIPAGRYTIINQVRINRSLLLMTEGRDGSEACSGDDQHGCAEFMAGPTTATTSGFISVNGDSIAIDHIVINGNKDGRQNSTSAQNCRNDKNEYGYNAVFVGTNLTLTNNVFKNALCATGAYLSGSGFRVQNNKILRNGVHNVSGMWSDGITAGEMKKSVISYNFFEDNTDVDLIFGACPDCQIQSNIVNHTDAFQSSSFAAIMIQAWPNGGSSGNYKGADISQNSVTCSAGQRCGIGIYLGNSAWYEAKVFGGNVHDNVVYGAQQGYAIDKVTDFSFANNKVSSSGGSFTTSCGKKQLTAFVVTPGTMIDLSQNTIAYDQNAQFSMTGCIPNWWNQVMAQTQAPAPTQAPAATPSGHQIAAPVVTSPASDFIYTLYRGLLQREPEAGGLQNYITIAAQTRDGGLIARGIANSPEYALRRNSISTEQVVTDLYQGLLGRPPENTAVVDFWARQIRDLGFEATVNNFINSDEFRARCTAIFKI